MIVREANPVQIDSLRRGEIRTHPFKDQVIEANLTFEVHMHFQVEDVDQTELLKRIDAARRIMEGG